MAITSRRFDQLIARRKLVKPKHRARFLHRLDGIASEFPTAPTLPAEPFLRDQNPTTVYHADDIPTFIIINTDTGDNTPIIRTRPTVRFNFTTEIAINPTQNNYHPYGTEHPSPTYSWNIHAHLLQQFVENVVSHLRWSPEKVTNKIDRYWNHVRNELASHEDLTTSTTATPSSDGYYENSEEEDKDTTEDPSSSTYPSASVEEASSHSPTTPRNIHHPTLADLEHLRSYPYNALFSHCDTTFVQFPLIPGNDYHFNDVYVHVNPSTGDLEIHAVCPEIVDITNQPDIESVDTPSTTHTTYSVASTAVDNTSNHPSDLQDTTTSSSTTYDSDPDYVYSTPSTHEATTNSNAHSYQTRYNIRTTTSTQQNTITPTGTDSALDHIDLTQSDTEDTKDSDCILLDIQTNTEYI